MLRHALSAPWQRAPPARAAVSAVAAACWWAQRRGGAARHALGGAPTQVAPPPPPQAPRRATFPPLLPQPQLGRRTPARRPASKRPCEGDKHDAIIRPWRCAQPQGGPTQAPAGRALQWWPGRARRSSQRRIAGSILPGSAQQRGGGALGLVVRVRTGSSRCRDQIHVGPEANGRHCNTKSGSKSASQ